ncbi:MAG TPA: nucleotide exchange factor GrpE [Candidatus Enterenecus stercoripullorum]|nr:nucleotide exchange factor GrpE [Candidatus Enterenecus stercoripullorum]
MSEKKKDKEKASRQETVQEDPAQVQDAAAPQEGQPGKEPEDAALQAAKAALAEKEDQYLRLAAEYDNYRKRTAKEKESAWTQAKADTVAAFLPVYDNLERALKQDTSDEAYAKGVEMTMKGLQDVLAKLGVEVIPALGETFDPNCHNAVMHVEDEAVGENTVVEVFQQGFTCGDKVIRFAMVKVAN